MILIKDSLVIDGTGTAGKKLDIIIKDDRISAIGHFPNQRSEVVIDGLGLVTAPGFIDVNTDSDHYLSLFSDRAQQDFLLQGVTSIIGGHCGSSLAPLIKGTLESVRKWGDINSVNINWNTMAEFLAVVKGLKLGVNFGTLVGHSTIRRSIVGEDHRDLTFKEIDLLKSVVRQALEDGALGVSTGLGYNHARNTPYLEVKLLAELAQAYNSVYSTHLRNEREQIVNSVQETISVTEETGVRSLINHYRSIKGFEAQFNDATRMLLEAGTKCDIHFDGYPFDYSMVPIYKLLPEWAQTGSMEYMVALIDDPTHEAEIRRTMPDIKGGDIVFASCPGFDYLVGKTLAEYASAQELKITDALIKLMKVTRLRAVLFNKNINLPDTLKALMTDRSFISSNSPSLAASKNVLENERAVKTFSRFLELAKGDITKSLEWAIAKITSAPAKKFNLKDRGVIREGAIADMVMLSDTKAVHVLVSGELAVYDGTLKNVSNGKVLKRT